MARANGSTGAAEVDFQVRNIGESWATKIHEYISDSESFKGNSGNYILKIPEYADFRWRVADVSDINTQLSAQINGYLVDNA